MSNKRCKQVLLAAPAAAALVAVLGVTTALAAASWTVTPGGAVTAKASQLTLTDTHTKIPLRCPASTMKAVLKSGSGLSGTGIATITSWTFGTCQGPLGFTFTLTLTHLPMKLSVTSYNAGTGTTTGTVTGLHGAVVGAACNFTIDGTGAAKDDGTVPVRYVNGTHKLTFLAGGNLHAYRVMGCGTIGTSDSDGQTITGTSTVTPAQTITRP